MLKVDNEKPVLGIPPAFSERCVVRCVEKSFGPNKKDNPMITSQWELVGYFDSAGQLQTEMVRGGKNYKLAGLSVSPVFFTLTEKALPFYATFYSAANLGEQLTEVDENNPNTEFMDGLLMQALVTGSMQQFRKQLTDEEKQEKLAKGEPAIGDVITDDEGKPIQTPNLKIIKWLKKFVGEVPEISE